MFIGARTTSRSFAERASGAPHHAQRQVALASKVDDETRKLVESIVCNVDRLALDAATVMSGVNTLRRNDQAMKGGDIAQHCPVQEHQLPFMLLALSEQTGLAYQLPETEGLLTALRNGKKMMQSFVDEETSIGLDRARIIYAERLKIVWHQACTSALQLISETNIEMRVMLPLAYRQNAAVLSSLLSGSMNGLSPCLNAKGRLYTPHLPQQRRWPRHTILQDCTVEFEGQTFKAFVQDASAGGLGLEQMPNLPCNSQLKVVLENGRTFACTVAWSAGNTMGVKFPAPLSQTDPLLTG